MGRVSSDAYFRLFFRRLGCPLETAELGAEEPFQSQRLSGREAPQADLQSRLIAQRRDRPAGANNRNVRLASGYSVLCQINRIRRSRGAIFRHTLGVASVMHLRLART
jgi:hypothetical protein